MNGWFELYLGHFRVGASDGSEMMLVPEGLLQGG
jgi:hypothetical protein